MIIAKIENQHFRLQTLNDAEVLLDILTRAEPVNQSYDAQYQHYYFPDTACCLAIEIVQLDTVTTEEHEQRRAARKEREADAAKTKEIA